MLTAASWKRDETHIIVRGDLGPAPVFSKDGLAVDLKDRREPLAELPAVARIARGPTGTSQERRDGLTLARRGLRDF